MSHIGHLYLSLLIVFAPFYLKVSACNKEQTNTTIGFRSNALSNRTHIFVLQCCILNKYFVFLSSVAFLNSFTNCQMYLETLLMNSFLLFVPCVLMIIHLAANKRYS